MRRLPLIACAILMTVGCAGPHSTGALWAQQNLEQEAAFFRQSDAQRIARAANFEQTVADSLLASERGRLEMDLSACPGPSQPLGVSQGDKLRDEIRLHAKGDPTRLGAVAQVALADWRLRRAAATSNASFCGAARSALQGEPGSGTSDLLARLPVATVTREPGQTAAFVDSDPPEVTLSQYALGYIDAVQAPSPLPQYLALVYGGFSASSATPLDVESAAQIVDTAAPAYPEWEPDALYAALRGSTS